MYLLHFHPGMEIHHSACRKEWISNYWQKLKLARGKDLPGRLSSGYECLLFNCRIFPQKLKTNSPLHNSLFSWKQRSHMNFVSNPNISYDIASRPSFQTTQLRWIFIGFFGTLCGPPNILKWALTWYKLWFQSPWKQQKGKKKEETNGLLLQWS